MNTGDIDLSAEAAKHPTEQKRTLAALRKCEKAYAHAFQQCIRLDSETGLIENHEDVKSLCGTAYKMAMPKLTDWQSIRAYIACVSQGQLLGVWDMQEAKTLMYTAQTALTTFAREQKSE